MKVGIIKGLLYYYDEVLWMSFFENLGVKTITNKEVTKETIKKGTSMAPDETCLSLKIFIGEVMELKDKCNAIFIPRLFSIKEHEQVCTNFNALYDLIHNLFPEVPLITSNIDLQKHKTEMKAYINIGKQLGYSVIATVTSYLKALDKDKKIREKNFLAQTEKLKSSSKKILLAGHPYILYENILTKEIKKIIKDNGFEIIYSNILPEELVDIECSKISKTVHWTHSKKLLAGISYYSSRVDGIILLSCFPCGPDSLTNELVKRKVNKPLLKLILENESNTGLITRLEAFFDIVKVKI